VEPSAEHLQGVARRTQQVTDVPRQPDMRSHAELSAVQVQASWHTLTVKVVAKPTEPRASWVLITVASKELTCCNCRTGVSQARS
jgi:hypothetical protein